MVCVSWMSFLISPEIVPGRGGILVTLLLVLTTFHLRELDRCPAVKEITPFVVWSFVCFMMMTLALTEYAIILYFIRFKNRQEKVAEKINKFLDRISKYKEQVKTRNKLRLTVEIVENKQEDVMQIGSGENNVPEIDTADAMTFDEISVKADYYALILFPLIFMIFLLIYWPYYLIQ